MKSDRDFYKEGYETGKNWDKEWRPGGPYICRPTSGEVRYYERHKEDKANSAEWFRGFDDGERKES